MQKKKLIVLNKKLDKAQHLLKLGTGVIKGALAAWINTQHSIFFLLVDVLRIFKNRYF